MAPQTILWLGSASTIVLAILALPIAFVLAHLVQYIVDPYDLRRYPGPLLAHFTDFWLFWVSSKKERCATVDELHRKYGPVVRIAPAHVSLAAPAAVPLVYGHSTGTLKTDFYDVLSAFRTTRGLFNTRSREEHTRKRRMMAHMFSPASVRQFEDRVRKHMDALLGQWDVLCAGTKDLPSGARGELGEAEWTVRDGRVWFDARLWCNFFTFDAIGELAFGTQFNMLPRGQSTVRVAQSTAEGLRSLGSGGTYATEEVSAVNAIVACMDQVAAIAVLPVWARWVVRRLPGFRSEGRGIAQISGLAAECVARRLQDRQRGEKGADDMFGKLLDSQDGDGKRMSLEELATEAIAFLVAGSDTTSNSVAAAIFYVARSPATMRKLQAELDTAIPSDDSPSLAYDSVKNLKYLDAVINETLRLFTTLGIGLPRTVPPGGLTVLGHTFPEGTVVSVPIYSVHHDEEVWGPDAREFVPERWLDNKRGIDLNNAFTPFSFGPRACIGRSIAQMEMTIFVGSLFRRYDVVLQKGATVLEVEESLIFKPREYFIGVRRRI